MTWMPSALRKEVSRYRTPMAAFNRVNLHIAVSEAASLFGYFSGASVCSHFYVRRDGTIEQYVDTAYRAAADYQGNDATISVETQGGVTNANGEQWTPEQIVSLARIYLWAVETHGIARQLATDSQIAASSHGLSSHRLGIDPYRRGMGMRYSTSSGKSCPGDARFAQVPTVFGAAVGGVATPAVPAAPVGNGGGSRQWLQQGDTGPAVVELQQLLSEAGFPLDADGVFGLLTEQATRAYQGSRGLVIDGLAGSATLGALRTRQAPVYVAPPAPPAPALAVLQRGSHGPDVAELQQRLRTNYPAYAKKLVVDGAFGPATDAVVREFQRRAALAVDGVVGPKTRAALGL